MHASIAKKLAKKMKRQAGFTLLEILVVLTIMGFLIAMVAPRLAGISGGAVDTVCDSNQARQIQMTAAYFEQKGKFPDKLTNVVVQDGATDWAIPATSNGNPDDGAEVLAEEFVDRVIPQIHYLTQDEVDELSDMGIKRVFNLNDYSGSAVVAQDGRPMEEVALVAGVGVMMSGAGVANSGNFTAGADLDGYGEANFLGRIIFGFGPENGLISSGLVSNAAHCPGGIQDSENVIYNDYNLVVPRLQATVDRFGVLFTDRASDINKNQYLALGYGEDYTAATVTATVDPATGEISAISADTRARLLTFDAQPAYQYATMCPEGHMFPADDSDFWAVDLSGDGSVTVNP